MREPGVRWMLVEYFHGMRQFRLRRSSQNPRDVRHKHWAHCLEQVRWHVLRTRSEDLYFDELARISHLFQDRKFVPPRRQRNGVTKSKANSMASRCHFKPKHGAVAKWYARWIRLVLRESIGSERADKILAKKGKPRPKSKSMFYGVQAGAR